jgi:regulator of protease activity HflC (stomatin/prohibitin superfamily)
VSVSAELSCRDPRAPPIAARLRCVLGVRMNNALMIVWSVGVVLFLAVFMASLVFATRFFVRSGRFRMLRNPLGRLQDIQQQMWSVEIRAGEVMAVHRLGSRKIDTLHVEPGRYWHSLDPREIKLVLRIDEPILVTSRPVEVQMSDGPSVALILRLTLDVTDPNRYVSAVVGEELSEWKDEVLPVLIARAAARHTVAQALNQRDLVAHEIAGVIAEWFAANLRSDFGLMLRSVAVIDAARRRTDRP